MNTRDWTRGYLCAIAKIIEYDGLVRPEIADLFRSAGDWKLADPFDVEIFVEYGLIQRRPRRLTSVPADSPELAAASDTAQRPASG